MGPVSAEIEIDVPREQAFAAIADLAHRPSFTDHFLTEFRLTRIESSGVGAGARFRVSQPLRPVWEDSAIAEADPPHRLVEHGRGGRSNRIPTTTAWEVVGGSGALTRVKVAHWTEPANPLDRVLEAIGWAAFWQRRGWREALRRLRDQLEAERPPAEALAVAGGNPHATGIP